MVSYHNIVWYCFSPEIRIHTLEDVSNHTIKFYVGVEPRRTTSLPEEEIANEPVQSCTTPENFHDDLQYEMHPQIGALPPLPTDQLVAETNSPICDELPNTVHPDYGLFPSLGETSVYQSERTAAYVTNNSEYELGGQSQPGSMVTSTFSYDTASSYDVRKDSLDMLKLEAKVKDLTVQLETAQAENRRKDAQIRTLQQLLGKASTPEATKNFGSHSFV